MGVLGGPNVVKDCLTLYLDTPNERSYKGEPTVNVVPYPSTGASRYNNTGFGGTITCTGQGTFKGSPVYLTTFIPTTTAQVSRLCSSDGFGFLHSMGCRLLANTPYIASVYFCTNYPLVSSASCGFDHGYSNISGWNTCSTTSTRIEECGWTRLYTRFFSNTNGFINRQTTLRVGCTINTNSPQAITFCSQIVLGSLTDSGGICAVVSHSPNVSFTDTLTGVTIANHGLNENDWCKITWPDNPKFRTQLPYYYYVQLSLPSTGGVNRTMCIEYRPNAYYCSTSDSKYWKPTFNPIAGGAVCGSVICTWWAAPMLEQKSTVYPSNFVIGTRGATAATGGGWLDISGNSNNGEFVNGPSFLPGNKGVVLFDGVNDYVQTEIGNGVNVLTTQRTVSAWVKSNSQATQQMWLDVGTNGTDQRFYSSIVTSGRSDFGIQSSGWANGVPVDLNWHFQTLVMDNGVARFYDNGLPVQTKNYTSYTLPGNIRIGGRGTEFAWNGLISQFKIYNRALSAGEIIQDYNATKTRFGL